ncbi:hypothetical protein NQ318_007760 [Aromia moschata]|uniref:DUF5641 domain-containing protein n=1 Tax=Aromia moschata TaxID=1265417 RepID=A0AAV8YZB9_9CUCU|nr:hypothetical protein NQ318_007760 [Aromia moschata]
MVGRVLGAFNRGNETIAPESIKSCEFGLRGLLTLVCECEAVVNARPLTYLSEDPSDLVALIPSMFLTDQAEFGLPDYDTVDNVSLCRKYLGQLKLLCDKKLGRSIGIDDLVLVGDDNHNRLNWPLGRVIEVLPGHLLRPVQKLYPLECFTAPEFGYEKKIYTEGVPEEADPDPNDVADGDSAGSVCAKRSEIKVTRAGRAIKVPSRYL